jgi:uncharacterized protein YjiS (DUF1127 family)
MSKMLVAHLFRGWSVSLSVTALWRPRCHTALRLATMAKRAVGAFGLWWRPTCNRAALVADDDRMLEDIGVTRLEAVYEIDKRSWTERSAPVEFDS